MLEDVADPGTLSYAVERIITSPALLFTWQQATLKTTVDTGIDVVPQDGSLVRSLWRSANAALRRACRQGTGTIEYADRARDNHARETKNMTTTLHRALGQRAYDLVYQPSADLETGHLMRVESPQRWSHPEQGMLCPDRFLHLLEDTGLINPVGKWVLEKTYEQAHETKQAGHDSLRVSAKLWERQQYSNDPIYKGLMRT